METFVNDTIQLIIDTNIDVSGYTILQVRYRKPDGTLGCWAASLCPANDDCMTYTCVCGDLDQSGRWLIQAVVLNAGVRLTGRWIEFIVHDPLVEFCTTVAPTTVPSTTLTTTVPTTNAPTTVTPTTLAPTTLAPTTGIPTTVAPTTTPVTTVAPTTLAFTTPVPTTAAPTTVLPTTLAPTTLAPTTPL